MPALGPTARRLADFLLGLVVTDRTEPENLLGTVRRHPDGTMLAVLWPSPPHPHRWMVTDRWGSCGYETDDAVANWPVVGAVPFSPAAGVSLDAADSTG